jgi:phosphatidylethanolamine-binding protein (PEBP) family uncharacterized protein
MEWWKSGKVLNRSLTLKQPVIEIPKAYSVVMYDPDAPDSKPNSFYHWIKTSEQEILPYIPPTPPPGSGEHHYIFTLVKGKVDKPESRSGQPIPVGEKIGEFIVKANINSVGGKRKSRKNKKTKKSKQKSSRN